VAVASPARRETENRKTDSFKQEQEPYAQMFTRKLPPFPDLLN